MPRDVDHVSLFTLFGAEVDQLLFHFGMLTVLSGSLRAVKKPLPLRSSFSAATTRQLRTMPAFLNQRDAQQLDVDLMSDEGGFKLEQVRERAEGNFLSIPSYLPPLSH